MKRMEVIPDPAPSSLHRGALPPSGRPGPWVGRSPAGAWPGALALLGLFLLVLGILGIAIRVLTVGSP